ncbi:histidine ammonia-lyase [Lysinibacillus agricola]|uniref:Histidine ammonia-lyase n=1 Tax=Lysinibacillus agricola TaxID=2590012 RepID=A0ABX7ANP7_9BACI|nr:MULTISPECIES: histidine ammonia-lyase [Lysinibacillus]KOS61992.1 histidine ammonia-lyase [Lysinibacillus sp. FJAT-14222]QQP11384.1 histidine ammonia-lyase [Lysinibacillus agricola]
MEVIQLDGYTLTRAQIDRIAKGHAQVSLAPNALDRVRESRSRIETRLAEGQAIYGVNTGFGKLSDVQIAEQDNELLQLNLLRSDAVGVGTPLETSIVRTMMVLRANALVKGYSGIREETLQLLVEFINKNVHPLVPSQGSVGASGDLAPLAHIALVLVGEGKAEYQGEVISGQQALARAGLTAVRLQAKEGLALINGTQAMTGIGIITINEVERLGYVADMAACLTMEALKGIISAFDEDLLAVRPHAEIASVGERIRKWLEGSERITTQGETHMQDAYSLRCVPQVHGASWQCFNYVEQCLQTETNATTDNPIVLENGEVLSGGHFHGQPIALAMDFLKVGVAEWANISERRTERLVNPQLSGLSPFLATDPGLECGLMVVQYVAASLVSENKVLAHPSSVDSIPTSGNQEDHVSMGTTAARQARQIVHNSARVLAIELIAASQAIFLEKAEQHLAQTTREFLEIVRSFCPPLEGDKAIGEEIETLANYLLSSNDILSVK